MSRVTDAEVKGVIETDITPLTPFIAPAHTVVNRHLVNQGYTDDELKQIELYLSAHFVTNRQRQLKSEQFGDAKDAYMGVDGKGLDASQYGQTAKLLEYKGILGNLGKRQASVCVL